MVIGKKIVAIKEAGFEGFAWIWTKEHGRLAEKHGLWTIGFVSSSEPAEFRSLIRQNIDGGALRINVQLGDHRAQVFSDEKTCAALEDCLFEAGQKSNWLLHGFDITSNHYHLAIEPPDANLVAGMQGGSC